MECYAVTFYLYKYFCYLYFKREIYMTKEFYTDKELANRWGLKIITLQSWRQKGLPPVYIKFGSAVRYPYSAIEQYEQDNICTITAKRAN